MKAILGVLEDCPTFLLKVVRVALEKEERETCIRTALDAATSDEGRLILDRVDGAREVVATDKTYENLGHIYLEMPCSEEVMRKSISGYWCHRALFELHPKRLEWRELALANTDNIDALNDAEPLTVREWVRVFTENKFFYIAARFMMETLNHAQVAEVLEMAPFWSLDLLSAVDCYTIDVLFNLPAATVCRQALNGDGRKFRTQNPYWIGDTTRPMHYYTRFARYFGAQLATVPLDDQDPYLLVAQGLSRPADLWRGFELYGTKFVTDLPPADVSAVLPRIMATRPSNELAYTLSQAHAESRKVCEFVLVPKLNAPKRRRLDRPAIFEIQDLRACIFAFVCPI